MKIFNQLLVMDLTDLVKLPKMGFMTKRPAMYLHPFLRLKVDYLLKHQVNGTNLI